MILGPLYRLAAQLPDGAILVASALSFGLAGAALSYLSHRYWFRRWRSRSAADDKLADTVHTSLLGFAAFVLALSVSSVFSNLAKVEDGVRQEVLDITRLDRELAALEPASAPVREALRRYVTHVADDEWPRLSSRDPTLSPLAQADLDAMWAGIRALQKDAARVPEQVRMPLNTFLSRIEEARTARLAAATDSIPDVFWMMILIFVIAATLMTGRNVPKHFEMELIVVHLAAIGLVIALVMIIDDPFRGQTSVGPDVIRNALTRQP